MKLNNIEAGALQVDSEMQIPTVSVLDKTNGIQVFTPRDDDLESGVLKVLREFAVARKVGGEHMFWEHHHPPLPHHPDQGRHSILWIDKLGEEVGANPWNDNSWSDLLSDKEFMKNADQMFAGMQGAAEVENRNLRIYYIFGFAKPSDLARIDSEIDEEKVSRRGPQSQYRGHIHVVDAIDDSNDGVNWLKKEDLLDKKYLVPSFLNTAGELAIKHYSDRLLTFGEEAPYVQTVDNTKVDPNGIIYNVERTMFAFSSWEEALGSVLELYNTLLDGWLKTVDEISKNHLEFANAQIKFLQGCLPGFTFIKPSMQDKIAGGVNPEVNWLVVPFSSPLPQAILQPGVLLNRLQPGGKS